MVLERCCILMLADKLYSMIYKIYFISYKSWKCNQSKIGAFFFRCVAALGNKYFHNAYVNCLRENQTDGLNKSERKELVVASLTSFPARINQVWITVETIMRQSMKPDIIELWLSREQFPGELDDIPYELLDQRKRGLSIYFCDDDLRSHKKYYYAMQMHPDAVVITFDDDFFYPLDTIEMLLREHQRNPEDVIGMANPRFSHDDFWKPIDWAMQTEHKANATNLGVCGGAPSLFPAHALDPDVFCMEIAKERCFLADDLWLTLMTYKNNRRITTLARLPFLIPVPDTQEQALTKKNNNSDFAVNNNTQWQDIVDFYFDDLKEWLLELSVQSKHI